MSVKVRAEQIGTKLYRLRMFIDGIEVGDYERSQEADIDRKTQEIIASRDQLLSLYKIHGELCVRWVGKDRKKSVRRADGVEVGVIARSAWRRPT